MSKPQEFTLVLVAIHRDDDPRGWRRMQAVLKRLLRGFGSRCVSIVADPLPDGARQGPGLPAQIKSRNYEQFESSDG
jgi:hypothetical protein